MGGKRTDSSRGSGSLLVEGVAVFVSGACCVGGGSTLSLPARRDDRAVSPRASLARSGMPANASAVGMVVKLGTVGRGGGGGVKGGVHVWAFLCGPPRIAVFRRHGPALSGRLV